MELSFLYQTYDVASPAVEAPVVAETRTFLGKRCGRKQFNISQRYPDKPSRHSL